MKNSGRMSRLDGGLHEEGERVVLDEECVKLGQLVRAATFKCDDEEVRLLSYQLGERVAALIAKALHGNTFQVPNNPPRLG